MKKVKAYIDPELAKKKIARYKYWSVKDDGGITICTSEENNPDKKTFVDVLKQVLKDNIDAEIQVRYGTSDQSSRQNPPLFIKINENIEWVEPEEETVNVNGIPHNVDKNGNVNINFSNPAVKEEAIKAVPIDTFRQEIDMRLEGIRREHELKEEKMKIELQNKLMEQTLKFREMMLAEREVRIIEREQGITQQEQNLSVKEKEIQGDVVGYLKQVPSALGSILRFFSKSDKAGLGKTKEETPRKKRKEAQFTIEDDEADDDVQEEVVETDEMAEQLDEELEKLKEEELNTIIKERDEALESLKKVEEINRDYENYINDKLTDGSLIDDEISEPNSNENVATDNPVEDDVIDYEEITPSTSEQNKSSPFLLQSPKEENNNE